MINQLDEVKSLIKACATLSPTDSRIIITMVGKECLEVSMMVGKECLEVSMMVGKECLEMSMMVGKEFLEISIWTMDHIWQGLSFFLSSEPPRTLSQPSPPLTTPLSTLTPSHHSSLSSRL
jgi:hypothetical protein